MLKDAQIALYFDQNRNKKKPEKIDGQKRSRNGHVFRSSRHPEKPRFRVSLFPEFERKREPNCAYMFKVITMVFFIQGMRELRTILRQRFNWHKAFSLFMLKPKASSVKIRRLKHES